MGEIIFIRHAETDLAGTFCGHTDPPLNAHGQAQVADLQKRLASEKFDAIYSSDLQRATETAASLAQAFAVSNTTTPNLREIYFGEWESMTWAQIESRDPTYAKRWIESFPHLSAPGGEPFADFESRVLREVDSLLRASSDKRIAAVTHSGVMRVILRNLLGHTEEQAWERTQAFCSSFIYTGTTFQSEENR